jgi:hypothetical protein
LDSLFSLLAHSDLPGVAAKPLIKLFKLFITLRAHIPPGAAALFTTTLIFLLATQNGGIDRQRGAPTFLIPNHAASGVVKHLVVKG